MFWSRYNRLFTSERFGNLLYNSETGSLAKVDDETYRELLKIRDDAAAYDLSSSPDLHRQLVETRALVPDRDAGYRSFKLRSLLRRFDTSGLLLTVAPTRDCNLACDYCFERERPPIYMSDQTEDRLIDFIKRFSTIKRLHIQWYGGEPLLAFERICSISSRILALDLEYSADLMTNGYLLDIDVIKRLKGLSIKQVHVTLDGLEDAHDQRRPHRKHRGSFRRIVSNLDQLIEDDRNEDIFINIRINVDSDNQDQYEKLHHFLKSRYSRKHISIYPGFVSDISGCCSLDKRRFDRDMIVDFMVKQYRDHGIEDLQFFPRSAEGDCIARLQNGFLVGPEGDLYKCWDVLGNRDYVVGNVHSSDEIDAEMLSRFLVGADPFEDPRCVECFYLPICGGGCPRKRMRNAYEGASIDCCTYYKAGLNRLLEICYEVQVKQQASRQETRD